MSPLDLATAVAGASLRAAIPLLCALGLCRMLASRTSAAARHALLSAALLAIPILPAAGALLPGLDLSVTVPEIGLPSTAGGSASAPSGPVAVRLAATAWMLGAALMLGRLGLGLLGASRQARGATPLNDPAWLATRDALVARLGARRAPELRVAASEIVPRAWGVLRPVVLLPPSALAWSETRRRVVLAHEIGHLVRSEPLMLVAVEALRAIHWFDPLVRLAAARVRRESELAADERAVGAGIGRFDYAAHLVAIARQRSASAACRAVASLATPGELEKRVEAILSCGRDGRPGVGRSLRLLPGIAGFALVLLTSIPRLGFESAFAVRHAERFGIPIALAGEILEAARREGIDPDLAFGLVAEESRFDPDRVSPAGAVGLTQILPATARQVSPEVDARELREIPVNLRVGFRYLRTQIEREGGDVHGALLAYSLGPRRLSELRESGAPIPGGYAARVLADTD